MNTYFFKSSRFSKLIYILIVCSLSLGVIIAANRLFVSKKKVNVLSATTVNDDRKNFINVESSKFKYYGILYPSTTIIEPRFWDKSEAYISVNSDGLNERYDYNVFKPESTYRIITLGDSFTYGQRMDTNKNWTEKLEDMLNNNCPKSKRYEVINLGMSGFDIPYIVKRFEDIGKKYNPDLIIWYESGSGFYRDREKLDPIIDACIDAIKVKNNNAEVSLKDMNSCWSIEQEKFIKGTPVSDVSKKVTDWMEYFLTLVDSTKTVIASGINIDSHHKDIINNLTKEHSNLYYTDSVSDLNANSAVLSSLYDGHPNEKGHMLIANDVFKYIKENNSLQLNCNN